MDKCKLRILTSSTEHLKRACQPDSFASVYHCVWHTHSSDCHSYLHCKYGKQCSGRDLKITPPRASVTKLINGGMGAERVLTMQVSLSRHILSSQPCCPIFLSLSFDCGLIRLNYTEVLSFIIGMGPGFSLWTPNKY